MKKTRVEKGITLIALIITIVVLLILAAVAISSITNDGILQDAENVANDYNKAIVNEQQILSGYENFINNYQPKPIDPKVGQYVEYDVSYDDIYNSSSSSTKTFGKTDGWRYLGQDDDENHLLISTGIPMKLNYANTENDASAQWWDSSQTNVNDKVTQGMIKNLANIPYSVSTGDTSYSNAMIGLFGDANKTKVGDYFKVIGKPYSSSIKVRTLTLAELNRAVNSANEGTDEYKDRSEDSTSSGFKELNGIALGLFDLSKIGLSNNYYYWLASSSSSNNVSVFCIYCDYDKVNANNQGNMGVRPVVSLPSSIQFVDANKDGVLEIQN